MQTAVHWVEYVAKNGEALHLQSVGVHLPFHVYYNLDVWATIAATLFILAYVLLKLSHSLWMAIRKSSDTKQKTL